MHRETVGTNNVTFGSGQESYNVTTTTQTHVKAHFHTLLRTISLLIVYLPLFLTVEQVVKHPDTRAGPYGLKGFTQSSPKTIYTILPHRFGSHFMFFSLFFFLNKLSEYF